MTIPNHIVELKLSYDESRQRVIDFPSIKDMETFNQYTSLSNLRDHRYIRLLRELEKIKDQFTIDELKEFLYENTNHYG